ncbi:hypothetical protein Tco_0815776 [Tanacetum coccineum]
MGLNPRRDSPYVMGFPIGSTIWALEARIDVAMAHSSWAWCPQWHCMGSFRSSGLNMGVPPCKSISLQGTPSKFDLACYCTVAYVVNRLHLFNPLSESDNSLSALKV